MVNSKFSIRRFARIIVINVVIRQAVTGLCISAKNSLFLSTALITMSVHFKATSP